MTPENLKSVMDANDLNVKRLSDMLYVSGRRVYRWLKGESAIPRLAWEHLQLRVRMRQSQGVMSIGDAWNIK